MATSQFTLRTEELYMHTSCLGATRAQMAPKQGFMMIARLKFEMDIRDQTAINEKFDNDFNGNGLQEVIENHVSFCLPLCLRIFC